MVLEGCMLIKCRVLLPLFVVCECALGFQLFVHQIDNVLYRPLYDDKDLIIELVYLLL